MKINVSETTPIQLDWLVAKCEGLDPIVGTNGNHLYNEFDKPDYKFSTSPAIGLPVVERNMYSVIREDRPIDQPQKFWAQQGYTFQQGPTFLIAALRCHVARILGNVVDIPEELS